MCPFTNQLTKIKQRNITIKKEKRIHTNLNDQTAPQTSLTRTTFKMTKIIFQKHYKPFKKLITKNFYFFLTNLQATPISNKLYWTYQREPK
jgi:fructose-1-phosphate kinase PfkB-like protein